MPALGQRKPQTKDCEKREEKIGESVVRIVQVEYQTSESIWAVGLCEEQIGEEEGRKGVDGHQNQGQENWRRGGVYQEGAK